MDTSTACDVVVVGSGAAGMAAAITARLQGLQVVVLEKEAVYGGTSALSGGGMWIPCNPVSAALGIADSPDDARRYMHEEAGPHARADMIDAFIDKGPEMVAFFEQNTAMQFLPAPVFPDYHPGKPGASQGGRTLYAAHYNGTALGGHIAGLRPPLQEMTLFGLVTVSGDEVRHFLRATKSWASAKYVARVFGNHFLDLLRYGRGMRLTNGGALVARLARSLQDLHIPLWLSCPMQELLVESGKVTGVRVLREGRSIELRPRLATVLACGGFPHDLARRSALFPHLQRGGTHYSPAPAGNTGDGLRAAERAGGSVNTDMAHAAAWVTLSRVPHGKGRQGLFPHFIDRAKPGMIAVNQNGMRFVNEADSYHDFVPALLASQTTGSSAFLICDHRAIRRYGLGFVKPFPMPLGSFLRSGYLRKGDTIAGLAGTIGVNAAQLEDTVTRFNAAAMRGEDPEFGKGSTAYNRFMGDADHDGANPCVAPLVQGPFYAVEIVIGDLGTFAGLHTDVHARVTGADGQPIAGLYAVGNDMASVMGGAYPGGGITLGPAMTFGYVAACHIAAQAQIQLTTSTQAAP